MSVKVRKVDHQVEVLCGNTHVFTSVEEGIAKAMAKAKKYCLKAEYEGTTVEMVKVYPLDT